MASEDGYFYLDLHSGQNEISIFIDPLRQFGSNAVEYKLFVYVGSIPEELSLALIKAFDGQSPDPVEIPLSREDLFSYRGTFNSGSQGQQTITIQMSLQHPSASLDMAWLQNQPGFYQRVPASETSFNLVFHHSGNSPFLCDLLVRSNGTPILYFVNITPPPL